MQHLSPKGFWAVLVENRVFYGENCRLAPLKQFRPYQYAKIVDKLACFGEKHG